ncbi:cupin domain-containing protein [bacterium]|nr:cupin domain-containing protein [bacterium]
MEIHTIHESEVATKDLPGRKHKMVVRPDNIGAKNMCAGVAVFPANAHAPSHMHEKEEEILYVLKGEGNMYFDGKPERIKEGSFMFVPKGVRHSLEATSDKDLKVFYVFSPPVIQGSYDNRK